MLPLVQINEVPRPLRLSTVAFAVIVLAIIVARSGTDGLFPILAALAVFFLMAWIFGQMTITVDDTGVAWHFRVRRFGGRVPIGVIREAQSVYVSWLYGYGYRWSTKGPIWRAWGLDCVKIHREAGRSVFLGSPDPAALIAAIEEAQARWLAAAEEP